MTSQRDPKSAQPCDRQTDPALQHLRDQGYAWSDDVSLEVFVPSGVGIDNAAALRARLLADAKGWNIAAPCRKRDEGG